MLICLYYSLIKRSLYQLKHRQKGFSACQILLPVRKSQIAPKHDVFVNILKFYGTEYQIK
jgi:hypothetical protein